MRTRIFILIGLATLVSAAAIAVAAEPDAKELAQRGYAAFKDVIAGDEAKLADAIRDMEQSRNADDKYTPNLYNLARAYLFEGITFEKQESFLKSEKTFARLIELDSNRMDALAFHGLILTQMSGGRDVAMFSRGAQELKTAYQRDPNDLTVRIVLGIASFNLPPQARGMIGVNDPVGNLQFIGDRFAAFDSDFAPHASVVMNAFIGEALMMAGEKDKARVSFERALNVPQPYDPGALAGRELLDTRLKARLNGGEKSLFEESAFSGCHSCHLSAPEKLLKR
jgi:tetratricopeptide (TPR) repeat protein